jgi:DNA replication protein DnaC
MPGTLLLPGRASASPILAFPFRFLAFVTLIRTGFVGPRKLRYWKDVMAEICPICEGAGLRVVQRDGRQFAQDCECRIGQRAARRLERAQIPRRYEHCSLESYETNFPSSHRSQGAALMRARKFVESYPLETAGTGLLLTGSIGVGKTHLAVGILQALVQERGATGLFYDYRDLLKQVQHSYNKQVAATELEILAPVFEAEVLVLDELGASKPTDWVWDTVAHILNTRYNDRRTTIITTNYANAGPLGTESGPRGVMREETLGDRIGERMRSRLQEMCVVVEMQGEDFRQKVKRASFA